MVTAEQANQLPGTDQRCRQRPTGAGARLDRSGARHPSSCVFRLTLPGFAQSQQERIAGEARHLLTQLDGIDEVQIEVGQPPSQGGIGQAGHGQPAERQSIPGVRQVIAVSSGKGGVGKSTVAVNLACALAQQGHRVGLLDADIYGPNVPTMLGVADCTPEVQGSGDQQRIIPIESCGVAMVSMGLLIDEHQPVIWRGPMLNGIIRQFLYQAAWGERDVLVVDLPPGTGDAQLSLAQAVPMAGVVIVTTPQQVSLQDARRGLAMFRQLGIPVLGRGREHERLHPPGSARSPLRPVRERWWRHPRSRLRRAAAGSDPDGDALAGGGRCRPADRDQPSRFRQCPRVQRSGWQCGAQQAVGQPT